MKYRKLLAAGIVAATTLLAGCVVVPVDGPGYHHPHRWEHRHDHGHHHGGHWKHYRHDHDGRRW